MKPPHWLCRKCGFIITDSGSEPNCCIRCKGRSWQYLGYEGEYDAEKARKRYIDIDSKLHQLGNGA